MCRFTAHGGDGMVVREAALGWVLMDHACVTDWRDVSFDNGDDRRVTVGRVGLPRRVTLPTGSTTIGDGPGHRGGGGRGGVVPNFPAEGS